MDKLDCLIRYIVEKAPRSGRTQIVKFLYLTDLESRRFFGRPVTNLQYIYHAHGPFEQSIYGALTRLRFDGHLSEEKIGYSDSRTGFQYTATEKPRESELTRDERTIVDGVLSRVAKLQLRDLLDLAYGTAPMRKAIASGAKGKVLEMDAVDDEFFKSTGIRVEEITAGLQQLERGEVVVLDEDFDESFDRLFSAR